MLQIISLPHSGTAGPPIAHRAGSVHSLRAVARPEHARRPEAPAGPALPALPEALVGVN